MRKSIWAVTGAMLLTAALAVTALAAAFNNGSFENGIWVKDPTAQGDYMMVGTGYADGGTINGWNVTGGNVDWIKSTYWEAAQGTYSLDLVGRSANGIPTVSQVLDTTAGKMYFVTFKLAGNPNTQSVKKVLVTAPGFSNEYEFDTTGKTRPLGMGWVRRDFTFTAVDATSTLSFKATQISGNDGPAIDDVTVTQIASGGDDCKKDGWITVIDSLGIPYNFKNQGDCVSFFATGEKNLADPRD